MIIIDEERASDSPFVERVWRSHSEGVNPFLSIAVNYLSSFRFCTRQRLFLEAYYSYLRTFGHVSVRAQHQRSIEHEKSHCGFVYHPRWSRGVAR
jgi:hypothetical protein